MGRCPHIPPVVSLACMHGRVEPGNNWLGVWEAVGRAPGLQEDRDPRACVKPRLAGCMQVLLAVPALRDFYLLPPAGQQLRKGPIGSALQDLTLTAYGPGRSNY